MSPRTVSADCDALCPRTESDFAIFGVKAGGGLDCDGATDAIQSWSDASDGVGLAYSDGWSCSSTRVEEGQPYTQFYCVKDDQTLSFQSS